MKLRAKMSIMLCIIFALLSTGVYLLGGYVGDNVQGLHTQSFAPVKIKKVPDEEDIMVFVYPDGIYPHGYCDEDHNVPLNSIRKGWLVAQYRGYCCVVFELKNTDIELEPDPVLEHQYYYIEQVPIDRLRITDYTARHGEEPQDRFDGEHSLPIMNYLINDEINDYYTARIGIPVLIAINAAFILLAVGINLIANAVEKRR